jgi:dTDP-4-dehydrorhamnose 3,5-epimerase
VIFRETPLQGVVVIELEPIEDERGWFARTFSADEFGLHGLDTAVAQCNVSFNVRRGTLRGLHYQAEPHGESKLVRCTGGALYDVVVDLRPDSLTFRRWHAVEITARNGLMLYVPRGLAHGFQTLTDDTEVFYQMSTPHVPSHARGVRWDDPTFAIEWPDDDRTISQRDRAFPDFVR